MVQTADGVDLAVGILLHAQVCGAGEPALPSSLGALLRLSGAGADQRPHKSASLPLLAAGGDQLSLPLNSQLLAKGFELGQRVEGPVYLFQLHAVAVDAVCHIVGIRLQHQSAKGARNL